MALVSLLVVISQKYIAYLCTPSYSISLLLFFHLSQILLNHKGKHISIIFEAVSSVKLLIFVVLWILILKMFY